MIESLLLTAARSLTFEQQRVLTNARERRREYVTILDADAVTALSS